MKHLKIFGGLASMAVLLAALLGAAPAQATVLCESTTTPCGASTPGTEIVVDASLKPETTATLETTGGQLEATCTESTVKAVAKSTSESLDGEVSTANLTWGGCTNITQTVAGGSLEVHRIAGTDNGTVTAKGFEVTIETTGLSCTYGVGEGLDLGVIEGGKDPVLAINVVVPKTKGSFLCAGNARWKAEYTVTSPQPLYLETFEGSTILCETTTTPCGAKIEPEPIPHGGIYPAGTEINASGSVLLKGTEGVGIVLCTGSTLKAETSNLGGSSETVGAEVEKANFTWGGECVGSFQTLAFGPIEIHHIAGTENGTVTIKSLEMTEKFGSVDCTYGSGEGSHFGTLTGGEHPSLDGKIVLVKKAGSIICLNSVVLEALFEAMAPQPLFVEPS
jgi:hypothetical protein